MPSRPSLVWFRQDLRLDDQPALRAAADRGGPVIPLFIWSDEEEGEWSMGSASRWWLHHSLERLAGGLADLGSRLVVRSGRARQVLDELIAETNAQAVFWCRRYEPAAITRDGEIKRHLKARGLHVESFNGSLLHEPWEIASKQERPYQVFTPFWKACRAKGAPDPPMNAPESLRPPGTRPQSLSIDGLNLLPKIDWAGGFRDVWEPGSAGAMARCESFLRHAVGDYKSERDRPDSDGTSRLSPHLHFGEISPRRLWQLIDQRCAARPAVNATGVETFRTELGWREFAHHVLYHFPQTVREPLRAQFQGFPWENAFDQLEAWQRGRTGFPIVDAGMRQLWKTGWMHNRVRMIVASFLTKDQFVSWELGARWFWDTLVDADLANNTLGWQWTAGCGADAAPYFRIFNPVSQGEKFDPHGSYVREWIPELALLQDAWIHHPWDAPTNVLRSAGVELGQNYPLPVLDHAEARKRALDVFSKVAKR